MQKILIITGGNKGIGKGIVAEFLKQGYIVYSFSRTLNLEDELKDVIQINLDLIDFRILEDRLTTLFSAFDPNVIENITLINNAGSLGKVDKIENLNKEDIENTFELNTFVPIHLTSLFIKMTSDWECEKRVLNISSGAAEKAKYGWSMYCSSKAALNLFSQSVALEQNELENGVKINVIYPGVVDTDMQKQIRDLDKSAFIDVDRFIEMKEKSRLNDIYSVGKEIFNVNIDRSINNGEIIRITDKRS